MVGHMSERRNSTITAGNTTMMTPTFQHQRHEHESPLGSPATPIYQAAPPRTPRTQKHRSMHQGSAPKRWSACCASQFDCHNAATACSPDIPMSMGRGVAGARGRERRMRCMPTAPPSVENGARWREYRIAHRSVILESMTGHTTAPCSPLTAANRHTAAESTSGAHAMKPLANHRSEQQACIQHTYTHEAVGLTCCSCHCRCCGRCGGGSPRLPRTRANLSCGLAPDKAIHCNSPAGGKPMSGSKHHGMHQVHRQGRRNMYGPPLGQKPVGHKMVGHMSEKRNSTTTAGNTTMMTPTSQHQRHEH